MKIFTHALYTWLLANLIFPFSIPFLIEGIIEHFTLFFIAFVCAFILSLPVLLISWLFLLLIIKQNISATLKLIIWYAAMAISVIIGVAAIAFVTDPSLGYQLIIPGVITSVISITIRYYYFNQLVTPATIESSK